MLDLIGPKVGNVRGKFRIAVAERDELLAIMFVDLGLDRVGAGKRGFLGHEGRRGPEREAGDVPQRLQRGRTHAALGHQPVEAVEVPLLLRRHAGGELGFGAVAAEHGELPRVDPRRTIFPGLVDAQHRRSIGAAVAGTPAGHARRPLKVRIAISAAPPNEKIAFHPASEMPRKRNWTSSQRTSGAWVICLRRSAVLTPLDSVEVHWVKPSKILASTPA